MRHLLLAGLACAVVSLAAPAAWSQPDSFLGKPLSQWAGDLQDKDPQVRRSAAFALGRIGAPGMTYAADLVRLARSDSEATVREMAVCAIGDMARAAPGSATDLWTEAGPVLQKVLGNDPSPRVRRSAAYALGSFGPAAAPASDALRESLHSKYADVRQNAAWALGQLGSLVEADAIRDLCDRLRDDAVLVRRDAAGALGNLGKTPPIEPGGPVEPGKEKPSAAVRAVPALMELVQTETDEVVRKTGLDALAHLAGPDHQKYAASLLKLLEDSDPEVARGAALVLGRIGGPSAAPAVRVLRKALQDDDKQVQGLAAAALANLGPEAAPAALDLANALDHSTDTEVRRNAAVALGHMRKGARPGVPALGRALKADVPEEVRRLASEALAHIGYPTNEPALPAIVNAIENDKDQLVRQRCVWSLFALDDVKKGGVDQVLEKVLRETDPKSLLVRYDAARAMANKLGPEAPDRTVDVLMHMLENRDLHVFKGTDARVEGAGNEASSGRTRVAESIGGDARYMAVQALGWMGTKASSRKDVVKALREAARDADPTLREHARRSLRELGLD
jgi:HEAT repeat protein